MRHLRNGTLLDDLVPPARDFFASLPRTRKLDTIARSLLLGRYLGETDMATVRPDDQATQSRRTRRCSASSRSATARSWRAVIRTSAGCGDSVRRRASTRTLRDADMPGFALVDLHVKIVHFYDVDDEGRAMRSEAQPTP